MPTIGTRKSNYDEKIVMDRVGWVGRGIRSIAVHKNVNKEESEREREGEREINFKHEEYMIQYFELKSRHLA